MMAQYRASVGKRSTFLAVWLLAAAGCGDEGLAVRDPAGRIEGRVEFLGPVPNASVRLVESDDVGAERRVVAETITDDEGALPFRRLAWLR